MVYQLFTKPPRYYSLSLANYQQIKQMSIYVLPLLVSLASIYYICLAFWEK